MLDDKTVKLIDEGLVIFQLRLKAQYEQRLLDIERTFRKWLSLEGPDLSVVDVDAAITQFINPKKVIAIEMPIDIHAFSDILQTAVGMKVANNGVPIQGIRHSNEDAIRRAQQNYTLGLLRQSSKQSLLLV